MDWSKLLGLEAGFLPTSGVYRSRKANEPIEKLRAVSTKNTTSISVDVHYVKDSRGKVVVAGGKLNDIGGASTWERCQAKREDHHEWLEAYESLPFLEMDEDGIAVAKNYFCYSLSGNAQLPRGLGHCIDKYDTDIEAHHGLLFPPETIPLEELQHLISCNSLPWKFHCHIKELTPVGRVARNDPPFDRHLEDIQSRIAFETINLAVIDMSLGDTDYNHAMTITCTLFHHNTSFDSALGAVSPQEVTFLLHALERSNHIDANELTYFHLMVGKLRNVLDTIAPNPTPAK